MDNTEKKQEPNPFLAEKRKFSYVFFNKYIYLYITST